MRFSAENGFCTGITASRPTPRGGTIGGGLRASNHAWAACSARAHSRQLVNAQLVKIAADLLV
jgi:hypothetical protein